MNEQLIRALYLGCFLLMLVSAFSAFFIVYSGFQSYLSQAWDYSDHQDMSRQDNYSGSPDHFTGIELMNLIMVRKRMDKGLHLEGHYGDFEDPAGWEAYPELVINGESYQNVAVESIVPGSHFRYEIIFDSSGKPVRIEIRGW